MSSNRNRFVSIEKSIRKAVKCVDSGKYGLSCGHFCLAFKASKSFDSYKQLSVKWKSTFLYAFDRHIQDLEAIADNQTVINAFNEAIDALPDSEDILYNKGIYFYKKGRLSEAVSCFVSSLALNPNYNLSHLCVENIKSSAIPRWHYLMINDFKRNDAFRKAIAKAVQSGYNTVLDIGSGSGLLSLYSVESGARKVFACEVSDMLCHLCRDVFKSNGVIDKVVLFNQMSTNLRIPQMIAKPVSLVVTEIFDAALFGEHVLTTIYSALKNLLDPNEGLVIPKRATVYGILIESDELCDIFTVSQKRFGNTVVSDNVSICADFADVKYTTINLSKVYHKKYLSKRFQIIDINFNDILQIESLLENDFVLNLDVECIANGRLDAIGIWFDLNLIEDIYISSEPPTQLVGWEQAIYPATVEPMNVEPKTKLRLSFTLNEDYLRLIDLKSLQTTQTTSVSEVLKFNSELIKYLNANKFHDIYIKGIEKVIESNKISKLIDFNYFPISSLHFIANQSITQLLIVSDDQEISANIKNFIRVCKLNTNKINLLTFDELVASNKADENALVLTDLVEPSGLIRSNILEKLAYLKIYSSNSAIFLPFKVIVKGKLIQSEDLIIRSRLISDDKVHGYRVQEFINIFETEIIQNIDVKKMLFSELSDCFDLLEINLNELIRFKDEINIEPNNECLVTVRQLGQLDAVLYWYELHLNEQIVINSIDLAPNWHLAAFVLKRPIAVQHNSVIHISCEFTNGFLRFKHLAIGE